MQKLIRGSYLLPKILTLRSPWSRRGGDKEPTDKPVLDAFQIHDIIIANQYRLPSVAGVEGAVPSIEQNYGLWVHAVPHLSHSCLPNATKSFTGDVMILHANRDITKGEEILIARDEMTAYDHRQKKMKAVRGFECDCQLCKAEAQDPQILRARRAELEEDVKTFLETWRPGALNELPPPPVVHRAEQLAGNLEATYDKTRFKNLPLKTLAEIQAWLISAYGRIA